MCQWTPHQHSVKPKEPSVSNWVTELCIKMTSLVTSTKMLVQLWRGKCTSCGILYSISRLALGFRRRFSHPPCEQKCDFSVHYDHREISVLSLVSRFLIVFQPPWVDNPTWELLWFPGKYQEYRIDCCHQVASAIMPTTIYQLHLIYVDLTKVF